MTDIHKPVMLDEVVSFLKPQSGNMFLDCTFGGGGHTRALLEAGAKVVAIDTDPQATGRAAALQDEFPQTFTFYDLNFAFLNKLSETNFDGILFDLGVSSFQLDEGDRGFSFNKKAPADMRLNPREGMSAAEFLEHAPKEAIVEAIRDFGEEPRWKRVVNGILSARGTEVLKETTLLAELIKRSIGTYSRPSRVHPATRSFQGIRIAVNQELACIMQALPQAFERLAVGGLIVVISFHSLEDRLIKRFFRKQAGMPEHAADNTPQDFREKHAQLITRCPLVPSEEEIRNNPRSRSAKLRVLKKISNNVSIQ